MDSFTEGYIECALWSSTDYDDNGEMRNENMDGEELAPETLAEMQRDCADFQVAMADTLSAWYLLGESENRAGHDFWLTRNRHGAGFWDRFYGDQPGTSLGNELSDCAKGYGPRDLYLGDDGLVYQS